MARSFFSVFHRKCRSVSVVFFAAVDCKIRPTERNEPVFRFCSFWATQKPTKKIEFFVGHNR